MYRRDLGNTGRDEGDDDADEKAVEDTKCDECVDCAEGDPEDEEDETHHKGGDRDKIVSAVSGALSCSPSEAISKRGEETTDGTASVEEGY